MCLCYMVYMCICYMVYMCICVYVYMLDGLYVYMLTSHEVDPVVSVPHAGSVGDLVFCYG
jgi:hypothetical protein